MSSLFASESATDTYGSAAVAMVTGRESSRVGKLCCNFVLPCGFGETAGLWGNAGGH